VHAPRVLTVIDLATSLRQQCVHDKARTLSLMQSLRRRLILSLTGKRNTREKRNTRFAPAHELLPPTVKFIAARKTIHFRNPLPILFENTPLATQARSQAATRADTDRIDTFNLRTCSARPRRYTTYGEYARN